MLTSPCFLSHLSSLLPEWPLWNAHLSISFPCLHILDGSLLPIGPGQTLWLGIQSCSPIGWGLPLLPAFLTLPYHTYLHFLWLYTLTKTLNCSSRQPCLFLPLFLCRSCTPGRSTADKPLSFNTQIRYHHISDLSILRQSWWHIPHIAELRSSDHC